MALHPLIPRENRYIRTELGKFCPFFCPPPENPYVKKERPGLSYTDLLNVTTMQQIGVTTCISKSRMLS